MLQEYATENNRPVVLSDLVTGWIEDSLYRQFNQFTIKACHDVVINIGGKALLVIRRQHPARDIYWPIGGGIARGVPAEKSLRKIVKKESGLEIQTPVLLGVARTFFSTDPFGHGKGVDSLNLMFYAKARKNSILYLNQDHEEPLLISPEEYKQRQSEFHPYVREIMDLALLHF